MAKLTQRRKRTRRVKRHMGGDDMNPSSTVETTNEATAIPEDNSVQPSLYENAKKSLEGWFSGGSRRHRSHRRSKNHKRKHTHKRRRSHRRKH